MEKFRRTRVGGFAEGLDARRAPVMMLYCLLVAAACLALCSKCSFLYPINDWTDANAYLSVGKGLLEGKVVYRDLYEHKGPLLYALHALACLVTRDTFLGVYLLEIVAHAAYLWVAYRLLALYGGQRAAPIALPALSALTLTSVAFQSGDSAEELCLPILLYALYALLRWLREGDAPLSARALLLHGALGGCVLWVKFTLLGLYVAWLPLLLGFTAARFGWRAAWRTLGWFALGALGATVPWVVYFGLNGAIADWLKTYLYDNIFLYADGEATGLLARAKGVLKAVRDWALESPGCAVPVALGLLWALLSRAFSARERWALWLTAGFAALGAFVGGRSYPYYGLALSAFAPLCAVAPCRALQAPLAARPRLAAGLTAAAFALSVAACPLASPNAGDLGKPREQTMQYRFAAYTDQQPGATLLNYDFMDAGFYTACRITPSLKYFHRTNVPLPEMREEQYRYVAEGLADFVVCRSPLPEALASGYELLAQSDTPDGFWYDQAYLYRRR